MRHLQIAAICASLSVIVAEAAGIAQAEPVIGARYVALGSSYAAGPGIAPIIDRGCERSGRNYPHQLAAALDLDLTDVTCSGATTTDILDRSQPLLGGGTTPRQIDAVTPDTKLVTITIGGNDIGLVGTMLTQSCGPVLAAAVPAASAATTALCSAVIGTSPEPGAADFDAVEQKMANVVRAVQRKAPAAEILLVEYLPAIDPEATLCPDLPLTAEDARTSRHAYEELVAATRAVASATGAVAVSVPDADEHTACSAAPWTNGLENPLTQGNITATAAPYHPNLNGMTTIADYVAHYLARHGG